MDDHVRIRYENSVEDLVAFLEFHMDSSPQVRRSRLLGTWVIPAVLMVGATIAAVSQHRIGWVVIGLIYGVLYLLIYRWLYKRNRRRALEALQTEGRNDAVLCEHLLVITPDELVERTPVSESKFAWSALEKVERTEAYTFVYTQAQAAHVIPRDSLIEGDHDRFLAALEEAMALHRPPPRVRADGR